MDEFKEFKLIGKPDAESYSFRGKNFVYRFNITLKEGCIFITGDAGENIFKVGEDIPGLKKWLLSVDEGYALSKGILKRDHYDEDYAKEQVKVHIISNGYREEQDIAGVLDILDKLDFSSCDLLLNSMSENTDTFPDYWEMGSMMLQWSPMAKIQFKQLVFAGEWFRDNEGIRHDIVMKAVSAFIELRKERSKDDNIVRFTKVFHDAADMFAILNRLEQKEYWNYVIARS